VVRQALIVSPANVGEVNSRAMAIAAAPKKAMISLIEIAITQYPHYQRRIPTRFLPQKKRRQTAAAFSSDNANRQSYFCNRRRRALTPAKPAKVKPNTAKVPGSGTAAAWIYTRSITISFEGSKAVRN
jgi:hypothetical protein